MVLYLNVRVRYTPIIANCSEQIENLQKVFLIKRKRPIFSEESGILFTIKFVIYLFYRELRLKQFGS